MELDDINLPVKVAELLARALAGIGLDLPLVVSQAFALVLYAAAVVWGVRRLRAGDPGKLTGWLVTVAFGLGILGVLAGWGQSLLSPLPTRVTGQVKLTAEDPDVALSDVRVELLDFRGQNIAREPGIVDSRSGFFVLTYRPEVGDRPRHIRAVAAGCAELLTPIGRSRLESEASFLVPFTCEPPS